MVAVSTVPFALSGAATSVWWLTAVLVVRGLGLGAVTIPVMAAAYYGLDRAEIPHASILNRAAQQIGGSFGTTALAVVLQHYATTPADERLRHRLRCSIAFTIAALFLAVLLLAAPAEP